MTVGIEKINAYVGRAKLSLQRLFEARGLDAARLDNLLMHEKSIALPCEDSITHAVNAAKPIVDSLTPQERASIRLLIVATESGVDFGKSISTYVQHYLDLPRQCRLFEVKQACYGGTAALMMAANTISASVDPHLKALVIATDEARPSARMTYAEPSQGMAGVAMLISRKPDVLALDEGASGLCSYEIMDTCRPTGELETGDADLSLLSYLDCLSEAYNDYAAQVSDTVFETTFQHLLFHTPFAGMVKGAHRKLARDLTNFNRQQIEADYQTRVAASVNIASYVGNTYSASLYLALISLLQTRSPQQPSRIGLFSYGSGCVSEFFSGVVTPDSHKSIMGNIVKSHQDRVELSVEAYDHLLDLKKQTAFGVQNVSLDPDAYADIYAAAYQGRKLLTLQAISDYHRQFDWS